MGGYPIDHIPDRPSKRDEKHILKDMADFVEFMKQQESQEAQTMQIKYTYSDCGEYYSGEYASRQEAIDDNRTDKDQPCYTAISVPIKFKELCIDADAIIEHAQECAYEIVGDMADNYLSDVTRDQIKAINKKLPKVIYKLFKKHGVTFSPNFYGVTDVIEHESEASDE